jgi:tetratricopeptide (TPR) repeat protein
MWGTAEHPILVLHLESPNRGGQGDSVYRTEQPCRALGQLPGVSVVTGSFLSPLVHKLLPVADVVVLCDVVEADLFPIIRKRRERGLPTIYEINDDFQAPQPWNSTAYLANNPVTRSLSSQVASYCDGVQFSTSFLEQRFGHLSPNRSVFVNHLWQMPTWDRKTRDSEVRVGWGGSLGHRDDVRQLVEVMAPILARYQHVKFDVMGPEVFGDLCQRLPVGSFSYRKGGDLSAYLRFVASLDIGVCPLEATDFNLGRSDVKFLEYASHGAATVAADLAPYKASITHGDNGLLYADLPGLTESLLRLVEQPELRRKIAENGQKYVATHRLEQLHASSRLTFMRECKERLNRVTPDGVHGRRSQVALTALNTGTKPMPGSSARTCVADALVEKLLDGLAHTRDGDRSAAGSCFAKASKLARDFYICWLYRGSVESDNEVAIEMLKKAENLQTESVAVLVLLADKFEAEGRMEELIGVLELADSLAPELGLALARLAEIAESQGHSSKAKEMEALLFSRNPFYALPHVRRVLGQVERNEAPNIELLSACLKHDERSWMIRFALGVAALALSTPDTAREHLLVALKYAPDSAPIFAQLARAEIALGDLDSARKWLAAAKRTPV